MEWYAVKFYNIVIKIMHPMITLYLHIKFVMNINVEFAINRCTLLITS